MEKDKNKIGTAAVITVSDSCSRGEALDTSGPRINAMLAAAGYDVVYTGIVPDEQGKTGPR